MNLKSLEYFVAVARDLNMTSAAQRLYISQQALSLQIQKLEDHYKVTLFDRHPKLQLTYAGIQFLEGATRILQENVTMINRLSEISSSHAGILRIGIPAYRAAECFPLILPEFSRLWPNVSLELVEKSSEEMLNMLCEGTLDLLIGTPTRSEVQALKETVDFSFLLDDRSYVIFSDKLLDHYFGNDTLKIKEQATAGTDLREFSEVPFILQKPPMRLRKAADECFQQAGFKPKIYIESSNTELMVSLYPCHLGAFFCRRSRVPSLMDMFFDCNAFPIKYNDIMHQTPVYLMRKKNGNPPAHVLDFSRLMHDAWDRIAEY